MAQDGSNAPLLNGRLPKWGGLAPAPSDGTAGAGGSGGVRIEDIRDAWKVREQAFLRAVNDAPPINDGDYDAAERRIAAEFTEAVNRVRDTVRARITAAVADAAKLGSKLDAARGEEAGARGRFKLAAVRAEHRDDLVAAERTVLSAERDLRVFRAQHNLAREPHVPGDLVVSAAWLGAILLLETLFNAPFFFVEGQSLLGAAFEGLLIGGANVGLGLLAGMVGLRLASHRQLLPWKLGGLAVTAAAVVGAVSLNGLMAARRLSAGAEDLAGLSPEVLTVAFTTFAAIGFLFAAYKGWQGFFETYPGYGHIAKRLIRARRTLEDLRHDFNHGAMRAVEEVMEDLEDELDADRDTVTAIRTIASQAEEAEQQANDAVEELRGRARWLIRVYRETNAEVRGEARAGLLDPDQALGAELPTADRARQALKRVEERLADNEKAYARGLKDLHDVMENLETDLAAFAALARTTAQVQRTAEGGADAPKELTGRGSGRTSTGVAGALRPGGGAALSDSAGGRGGSTDGPERLAASAEANVGRLENKVRGSRRATRTNTT